MPSPHERTRLPSSSSCSSNHSSAAPSSACAVARSERSAARTPSTVRRRGSSRSEISPGAARSSADDLPPLEVPPGQPVDAASTTRCPRRRRDARPREVRAARDGRSRARDRGPPSSLAARFPAVPRTQLARARRSSPRGRRGSSSASARSPSRSAAYSATTLKHPEPRLRLGRRVQEQALVDECGERRRARQRRRRPRPTGPLRS